jgi:hypothetical protein
MNTKGHCKGKYTPRNPKKYVGNIKNIHYRSSWELDVMKFLDNNTEVIKWGSECIAIPYVKPTTGRVHKYYPDFYVEYRNRKGKIIQELVEVKPEKQIKQPTTRGKSKKTQLYEALTWSVNTAKWRSAELFCHKYGFKWKLVSEKGIFR